jgi:hypothetical protein
VLLLLLLLLLLMPPSDVGWLGVGFAVGVDVGWRTLPLPLILPLLLLMMRPLLLLVDVEDS